jgi:argininosuccinate lyase
MAKLWGGAFEKETDRQVEVYTASMAIDERMWEVDIAGSIAHATMLGGEGILPKAEAESIIAGLQKVAEGIREGKLEFNPHAEDVHSEIERFLTDEIGPIAGKLHTARSRNDQVATDTRLYLRAKILDFNRELKLTQEWLLSAAKKEKETVLPGMTHLQHAQPVSLAHHLLAYFWMFSRDRERLSDLVKRVNRMPLGSAALAGTPFPINRQKTSKLLGFDAPTENSLDAVSDRDYVIEFLSAASLVMMHLSRLSEELIIWSTPEFGYVKLDDSVTTGSSIMPQKKNPDVAELIRGKTGRVYGALMGALTMLKALPLSYNRDLQEDKTFLFEGVDTALSSVRLMRLMLSTAKFNRERMKESLAGDFSNATEIADYLAARGLPFRQAHEVSGRTVKYCVENQKTIEGLTLSELQSIHPEFSADVIPLLSHVAAMRARKSEGGTGVEAVDRQIALAEKSV